MDAFKKLQLSGGAALAALALFAGPAVAAEDADVTGEEVADDGADIVGDHGEAEGGKMQVAETPRDQLGLVLLAALGIGGWLAASNARRQLKGERPQATGEFRWR